MKSGNSPPADASNGLRQPSDNCAAHVSAKIDIAQKRVSRTSIRHEGLLARGHFTTGLGTEDVADNGHVMSVRPRTTHEGNDRLRRQLIRKGVVNHWNRGLATQGLVARCDPWHDGTVSCH